MKMKHKLFQLVLILSVIRIISISSVTGQTPVTQNASPESRALLNYIYSQYGKKTLSGQMWSPWAKNDEIQTVFEITGKYPAIRGQDYINEKANKHENELAIEWWKAGGIPTIMWHWGAPSIGEGYENSKKEINIDSCFISGTKQYIAMWSDLKRIADHLTELRDANVPVLWRPMHECDGNWFWYGKQGGERFVKLWKTMFDYFSKERKLNNLIWVVCHTGNPSAEWDPGKAYYDIAGGDTYGKGIQAALFNKLKAIHGEAIPIPYHECGTLPDPDECFKNGVTWSWWMLWHTSYLYNHNKDDLKRIYNNDLVITRDKLPNIMDYLDVKTEPKTTYLFQNPDMPIEERVSNIVSLMTLNEKVAFLSSSPGVERLGIKRMGHVEGLHGLAQGAPGGWGRRNPISTTTFPQAIGMGETWDPEIVRQAGAIEGYEARYVYQSPKYKRGGLIIRAPNADLGRDPRWGRTEECFGEDPYFNGVMAVGMIKGLQGDDPKFWLSASLLKHFCANSNEDNRTSTSSNFDTRQFYEYYSFPFHMGFVEGGAKCYMTSYNLINGVPATVNPVIEYVTVKQWGVDGIICTDAGGFANLTKSQHYYENTTQSGAGTVNAGINQYLDRNFEVPVKTAIKEGLLTEKRLDEVIKGTLRVFIRLGLLDPADHVPYAKIGTDTLQTAPWNTQKNQDLVRLATQKSIVLLKNTGSILPLDKSKVKSIAMIGPRADQVIFDWYSSQAPYAITPLAGVRSKVGKRVKVQFASGDDIAAAIALAKTSDVAIVCVGNNPNLDNGWKKISSPSEGREDLDRKTITLDEQEELIKQVLAANPKTIVVLKSSFPYAINWTQENVPAILHMAHSSQEEGNALADVLFGDYNPGGRLVQTWPKSQNQLPEMLDYDIRNGRTYMYFKNESLYPFGFGLSYTTFVWSNFKTGDNTLERDGSITVNVDVQNTGKHAGDEVVQLYVKHLNSKVSRPAQELKGFQRVSLNAGESKTVAIELPAQRLAYWDISKNGWQVERDSIEIRLGASSADIRLLKTLVVK
jgi:beta-glucosidase